MRSSGGRSRNRNGWFSSSVELRDAGEANLVRFAGLAVPPLRFLLGILELLELLKVVGAVNGRSSEQKLEFACLLKGTKLEFRSMTSCRGWLAGSPGQAPGRQIVICSLITFSRVASGDRTHFLPMSCTLLPQTVLWRFLCFFWHSFLQALLPAVADSLAPSALLRPIDLLTDRACSPVSLLLLVHRALKKDLHVRHRILRADFLIAERQDENLDCWLLAIGFETVVETAVGYLKCLGGQRAAIYALVWRGAKTVGFVLGQNGFHGVLEEVGVVWLYMSFGANKAAGKRIWKMVVSRWRKENKTGVVSVVEAIVGIDILELSDPLQCTLPICMRSDCYDCHTDANISSSHLLARSCDGDGTRE